MYRQSHSVPRALFALQCPTEPVRVGVVVLLAEKAGITLVVPLYDVKRNTVEVDTRAARHFIRGLAEIDSDPISLLPQGLSRPLREDLLAAEGQTTVEVIGGE